MPRIIAYTYCADVHCPGCADAAYAAGRLVRSGRHGEYDFTSCGDCGAPRRHRES